jgi:adenosine deaminase
VPVTVNTDDPPMFNTTLDQELQLLPTEFGFDLGAIDDVLLNGIRHSFIEPERRDRIAAVWSKELDRLKREHLP